MTPTPDDDEIQEGAATREGASSRSPTGPIEAESPAVERVDASDATPFASEQIGSASAPPALRADAAELIAIVDAGTVAEPIGPLASTEPPVDAPLAVAGGDAAAAEVIPEVAPAAARIAPVVVKTRTGPVALEAQPPAPIVERPAPVAIRPAIEAPAAVVVPKPARLASLDIFRGITIAMMVLVNNEGVGHAYAALDHAEWHGWTPTDLVFPFFLFIVGVATPFSLGKRAALDGTTRGALLGRIWLRALSLLLLGWLLSGAYAPLGFHDAPADGYLFTKCFRAIGMPFALLSIFALLVPWWPRRVATLLPIVIAVLLLTYCIAMHFVRANAIAHQWDPGTFGGGLANPDRLRIPGVLQRIGVCYGVAASIALLAGRKTAWLAIVVLFTAYSWLMLAGKMPDQKVVGSLTPEDNFSHHLDVFVFERSHVDAATGKTIVTQKHTWRDYADNEGIVSTLPAIGTALIGVLVGWWLRRGDLSAAERCAGLLARGVVVTCVGALLGWWLMPINKNLWTPSFSVFTAGLAMLGLGSIFWIADVRQRRWWAWPFKVMGMNAIAAFVASSLVSRINGLIEFRAYNPLKHAFTQTTGVGWLKNPAADGVGRASDWMHVHAAWAPTLNTPQNTSLAGALSFVCVIFALMFVLYVCRIFVKV